MTTTCPSCSASTAELSRFCWRCGTDLLRGDKKRRSHYAAHPGESVNSLNVITSVMPDASGDAPQAFRFALLAAVGVPIILVILGFVAVAVAAAAISVPVLYLFYFYDTNKWEDQPGLTVGLVVALSAVLGIVSATARPIIVQPQGRPPLEGFAYDSRTLLSSLIAALITVLLSQIGPIALARRPKFDDLIDGLTFGVAAGSSFAAGETLSASWEYLANSPLRVENADTVRWITDLLELGLFKPLIVGAAVGLVVAAFSGVGEGPGRFSKSYLKSLAVSTALLFVWFAGNGAIAGFSNGNTRIAVELTWSLLVAGYLVLRLRVVLHSALIEAAAEAAARGSSLKSANKGIGYCPECGVALIDGANFCSSCGTSVRAHSKQSRHDIITERTRS